MRLAMAAGRLLVVGCCLVNSGPLSALDSLAPLPSPLTLEQALKLADRSHPERELAEAALLKARAEQVGVAAADDLEVEFSAALSAVDPSPVALDQSRNDSWARLRLSKQLSDFGHTERALAAADAARQGQSWQLLGVRLQRRLQVMARFFDVLLSDLEHARDNEAMANAYVELDRARSRNELGQLSDIELLELESAYQRVRLRANASQQSQRITRSLLAVSLNRPDDLPADLIYPPTFEPPTLQEIEVLTQQALANNPSLLALRAEVEALEQRLRAAAALDNPVLRAELETASYNRNLGGRNPLTASLVLEVPLFSGGRVDAQVARERAHLQENRAKLRAYELELRQQLLEQWLELQRLQIRREELLVTGDFRDLYLERSRSLYDLEVASDLGDSMTQITDLQLQQAENDLQIRLTRARLEALTGNLVPVIEAPTKTDD
jgi:outer membrane protein TolC